MVKSRTGSRTPTYEHDLLMWIVASQIFQIITSTSLAVNSSWNAVKILFAMDKNPLSPPVLKMLNAEKSNIC